MISKLPASFSLSILMTIESFSFVVGILKKKEEMSPIVANPRKAIIGTGWFSSTNMGVRIVATRPHKFETKIEVPMNNEGKASGWMK